MPIFDSQYPVNSNPAGEDKILTTDTSDSSAVKSVTLTKVQEWLGSISKWVTNGMIADGAVTSDKIDFATFSSAIPAFAANLTSNQSLTSGVYQDGNFTAEVYDTTGSYNASTATFVAPRTGVYHFDLCIGSGNVSGALAINVNGSQVRRGPSSAGVNVLSPLSTDVTLTAGDSVKASIYVASGATAAAIASQTWFNGHMVV